MDCMSARETRKNTGCFLNFCVLVNARQAAALGDLPFTQTSPSLRLRSIQYVFYDATAPSGPRSPHCHRIHDHTQTHHSR